MFQIQYYLGTYTLGVPDISLHSSVLLYIPYARYPEENCVPPQPLGEYLALSSETYRQELLGNDVCALYYTYLPP